MKRLFAALALSAAAAPAFAADPVVGLWKSEPGETGGYIHVNILECQSGICGVIESVHGNDNQTIVGKPIIWAMEAQGGGKYTGGKIWAPDQDKTYNSKMTLTGNALRVEGCVAVFCRGQNWTRIK